MIDNSHFSNTSLDHSHVCADFPFADGQAGELMASDNAHGSSSLPKLRCPLFSEKKWKQGKCQPNVNIYIRQRCICAREWREGVSV